MESAIFDVGEEIQLVDQAPDRLGIEPAEAFFLCQTAGMVSTICAVFEAERLEDGIAVVAYGRDCVHEIQVRGNRVMLGSRVIDDKAEENVESFFAGLANVPESWAGVVRHVYKTERATLWLADFSNRLKSEWNEFLRVRKDRLGF